MIINRAENSIDFEDDVGVRIKIEIDSLNVGTFRFAFTSCCTDYLGPLPISDLRELGEWIKIALQR